MEAPLLLFFLDICFVDVRYFIKQKTIKREKKENKMAKIPNFIHNTDIGQNFLIDHSIVDFMIGRAKLTSEDKVLEIGPGEGILIPPRPHRARPAGRRIRHLPRPWRMVEDQRRRRAGTGQPEHRRVPRARQVASTAPSRQHEGLAPRCGAFYLEGPSLPEPGASACSW